MSRVITNTFTLTAVKDNEAVRDNLIHCSLMNKNRMTWWNLPDKSKVRFCSELEGRYMIMGHTGLEWIANPGYIADVQQYLAMYDRNNTDISNSALKNNTWYTLTFRGLGICRHYDENNQAVDKGTGYMYVYIYPSVVDTKTKYIVDGVEKWPVGDMATPIPLTWTAKEHTITFKTASSFSSMPRILFRSFGEGNTQYDNPSTNYYPFKEGGCLVRIAGVKLEEAREATAFKPHITEYQPPIHATAFKRTNDNLTKAPEGGSYTSPTPTGWSDGIPEGTARLWTTKAVFLPEETTATWSKPSPVGDTVDLDVEFSPYTGIPNTDIDNPNNLAQSGTAAASDVNKWFDPTRNPTADFSIMVWRAERKILNGVKSSWVISKIKGEDGTSFTAKGSADKHYVSLSAYNAATDRVVGKYYLVDSTSGAVMYKYNESTAIACDDGDAYTTSDLHLWVKNGPIWADLGKIQGPQGAQGPQGEGGMSCTLVPSVQSIPVDSNGRPTISVFKLTAKIYKGSTLMRENDKTYSIVSHVSYKGVTTPVTSSTNASFNLDVNLDKTKVLNSVSCLLQRGQTVLHEFNLYPHADGQNTVRLDLDNEMDSVVCDNNGNLLAETTIQTTLRLYDGAELKASEQYGQLNVTGFELNGIIPVKTVSRDGMTCTFSWTFNAERKFSDARYIKDFSIQYNGTFYLATFTLNAMRNGENGDDAVRYNVSASESAITFKRKSDNSLSPSSVVLKCNVVKTVGETISLVSSSSYNVPGASLYLYYKRVVGYETNWQTLTISSGEVTVRSSDEISAIKFCLSTASSYSNVDSNIIDIETVPVVIDGLNGSNGNNGINGIDGVTLDFLSSANTIMMDDKGVEPSTITFTAMSAQGENAPDKITSSAYNIVVTEYYNGGYESTTTKRCDEEPKGQLVYNINYPTSVEKLVAELKYNSTTYRTLTIPVVKKGADGRSYNPVPRGVYAAGNTYIWDAKQRDYVDYEFDGVYYRFGVKTFGTSVTAAPTKAAGDSNWEVCNRVSCLITNCIFGTNAVIGGFVATEGRFMSVETAYAIRYAGTFGSSNVVYNYRGSYSSSYTYTTNDVVYYSDAFYRCTIANNTNTISSGTGWSQIYNSSYLYHRAKDMKDSGKTGQFYLYEYTSDLLIRPVIASGDKYYVPKQFGTNTSTTSPSSSTTWRELTSHELTFLSTDGVGATAYIPKYTLNGKNGGMVMVQPDDTCWTYDEDGRQINGILYGKRIEIVPASKSIEVYDDSGNLALLVNGETYNTTDAAYGSASGPSGSVSSSASHTTNNSYNPNPITYTHEMADLGLISNDSCKLSINNINFTVNASRTSRPSSSTHPILGAPEYSGGMYWYANRSIGQVVVQKRIDSNHDWATIAVLARAESDGITGGSFKGNVTYTLSAGYYYRIVFQFTSIMWSMSAVGSMTCSFTLYGYSYVGNYIRNTSRVFANGLIFGSATDDNFMVIREPGGIHVKASTSSKYGFELSQDKGLEVKRGGQQGIVPVLLYAGRFAYLSTGKSQKTIYSYSGDVTYSWPHIGICKITLPSSWPCTDTNCIPTVTTYQGVTGVSARIASWSGLNITIEIDNDYSSGADLNSDHDYGGFYIKLEYIDPINNS